MKYFSERHLAMNAPTRNHAYDDEDRLLIASKCMLVGQVARLILMNNEPVFSRIRR